MSTRDIRLILLNYGADGLRQPATDDTASPLPDAGLCSAGSDRHQLSKPDYYSEEKVDAGQRPNTGKKEAGTQRKWLT